MKTASIIATCVLALSSTAAMANECPAGKEGPTPFKPAMESKGSIEVIQNGKIDLDNEEVAAKGWHLRSRTIYFGKDSVAQLHSHDKRPEIATMLNGKVMIYSKNCTVGVEMKPGDVYRAGRGDSHWAVNESGKPAVMYATDIVSKDTFPGSHDKM
ncbi:cupin domain-containing protein [Pseudomonas sp. M30-35]|uniref:cupin domain-containing protein n=1 Tax=Pseudomonas sp. M30-35 TaxID=1981174 RepID=UPI000B3CCF31|nr:cupin domain-containing protein [Pseudomonas sp. M30-35]ARU87843.1 cupin [Pseudomonas sp. M30-35]